MYSRNDVSNCLNLNWGFYYTWFNGHLDSQGILASWHGIRNRTNRPRSCHAFMRPRCRWWLSSEFLEECHGHPVVLSRLPGLIEVWHQNHHSSVERTNMYFSTLNSSKQTKAVNSMKLQAMRLQAMDVLQSLKLGKVQKDQGSPEAYWPLTGVLTSLRTCRHMVAFQAPSPHASDQTRNDGFRA